MVRQARCQNEGLQQKRKMKNRSAREEKKCKEEEEKPKEESSVPWAWLKAVDQMLSESPFQEPTLPVELLPWLYLSDEYHSVHRIDTLLKLGITHVLTTNAMSRHDLKRIKEKLEKVGIMHLAISAEDELGYDMMGKHWEECHQFLEQARDQRQPQGKVVVHCAAGMNRSGLMAAAAMLTLDNTQGENDKRLLDVVADLKSKRGLVLTNSSFQKQLCELAAREGRLGDKPHGYTNDPLPEFKFIPLMPPLKQALDRLTL